MHHMVCLGHNQAAQKRLRYAQQLAEKNSAKPIAIYVESTHARALTEQQENQLLSNIRYAEQQGFSVIRLRAPNQAKAIVATAQQHNVTHIVMGKSLRAVWLDRLLGSIVHTVVRLSAGQISVHILSDEGGTPFSLTRRGMAQHAKPLWKRMLLGGALTFVLQGALYGFGMHLTAATASIGFLLIVVFAAYYFGRWVALANAMLSALLLFYHYLGPTDRFAVDTL